MRLDKFLAHCGFGTRKEVKKIIRNHLVCVNKDIITNEKYNLSDDDKVYVDDELVTLEKEIYLMMNKGKDSVCSKNESNQISVYEYISHPQIKELFTIGRLDKDTTGLLIFTNDGKLAHQLLSKKNKIAKVYEVTLKKEFDSQYIPIIQNGITYENETFLPAEIEVISPFHIILTLYEGKFHQVKKMMLACDNEVVELHRSHFNQLPLDPNLQEFDYRKLTDLEIQQLRRLK